MKLARVQKQKDIEQEVMTHGDLLQDKEKKEELLVRLREKEKERIEEKHALRKSKKGVMRIEEEL